MITNLIRIALILFSVSAISKEVLNFSYPDINKKLSGMPVWSIQEDSYGLIWIGSHAGVYQFDGIKLKQVPLKSNAKLITDARINVLYLDSKKRLWLGSNKHGLYYLQGDIFVKYNLGLDYENIKIKSIKEINHKIWIASNSGLFKFPVDKPENLIHSTINNQQITQIQPFNGETVLIGTDRGLKLVSENDASMMDYGDVSFLKDEYIRVIYKYKSTILIGTRTGLYDYESKKLFHNSFKEQWINSLRFDGVNLWIGTVYKGLYKLNLLNDTMENYTVDLSSADSIADNAINSLYIDKSDNMWIATFHNGISHFNLKSLLFERYTNDKKSISCSKSRVFSSQIIEKEIWWLGTEHGLVRYNSITSECKLLEKKNQKVFSNKMIISLDKDKNNLWVSTGERLNYLDTTTLIVDKLAGKVPNESTYFSLKLSENERLIGTYKGLYIFDTQAGKSRKLQSENKNFEVAEFYKGVANSKNEIYLATSMGLARLDRRLSVISFAADAIPLGKHSVYTMLIDDDDSIWAGIGKEGLYHISPTGNLITIVNKELNLATPTYINSIEKDSEGNLWLGTDLSLIRYKPNNNTALSFYKSDGLQNSSLLNNSSTRDSEGNLYFGGRHGLNRFKPKNIKISRSKLTPHITSLLYFNKKINSWDENSGYKLEVPMIETKELELSYKDYIIGFEFVALDYSDPSRINYAYRLSGFNEKWVYTDASNRLATYTNLSPGSYTFEVKASNKDGQWSDETRQLKIIVNPAPWLSPWAFAFYLFVILIAIWGYIRYKTHRSHKHNLELSKTVSLRTQEVTMQKKMLESLLEHKSEVFANVTHEFKTPLTLILGPIEQLEKELRLTRYSNEFNIIQRNAKRLMLMVTQILKLSQAENNKETIRESQNVQTTLLMVHESFKPLALDKNIKLAISNRHDVNIYATPECLEIIVGNLLSNALKFTNTGGQVKVSTRLENKQVYISVQDSGSGIQSSDQDIIFNRFTRLNTHKNISGTGIGLSVVKEISQANHGSVSVQSEWGKGSTFTVSFPLTDIQSVTEMSQPMVDQLVTSTSNALKVEPPPKSMTMQQKNRIKVLIIEDNLDMQNHIANVLSQKFNCLFADRGRKGIAMALKKLPDIVICDVMMPEMDGYQVTRILRHDSRTSHIPIVLLTALNTTESRIKGWLENIDTYMTKPFNAKELNVQLDNILNIRSLLQKKTDKAIKYNTSLESLDLSKKDLKFIDKLRDVIGQHYVNEYFQKADIASKMAVSERQLYRKVKALIDKNPMDMLRDYRLDKACMKLKEGNQVNHVSDQCGFSSVAYFCRCFKKKYGITAKQYQKLNGT